MHHTRFKNHQNPKLLMAKIDSTLTFTVRRRAAELIVPAKPTPRELKPLSDIDNEEFIRFQVPLLQIYHVIREALAKLLVFYYPFAGRIKEGRASKLMVDCSGEGVLFIEAEADVTLNQFGDELHPPFPCMKELLYDVPGSGGILDSPLVLIQVTLLRCGGFIFAIRINHTMSDLVGAVQFMHGLGEIARGATSPSTLPVWRRELFCSSDRPHDTSTHRDYDRVADTKVTIFPPDAMAYKSLFFTTTEISAFRRLVPLHLQSCSTFEMLTTCLWRCRTIALQPDPEDQMSLVWPVNARKMFNPPIPMGYYGNAFSMAAPISTADLCNKPLDYALELVMKAKSDVTKDYATSVANLKAIERRFQVSNVQPFFVADLTRAGFDAVDFGWGKAAYGGGAIAREGVVSKHFSFYVRHKNNKGEFGILVTICLPRAVMDRFVKEVHHMLAQGKKDEINKPTTVSKL